MAYNHGREDRKWRIWKEAEEKLLRECNVDEAVDISESVVHAVMADRLKTALSLLSDSEQALVKAIFYEELSEREVGLRLGITQSVVNKRKAKILTKLRKMLEN